MNKNTKINKQSGAAMLVAVVFFLFISLAIISGLVSPSVREFKNADSNLNSKRSYFLAESGSEDAMYRVRKNYTIGASETITLDSNSATTTITSPSPNSRQITSLGDVHSLQRKVYLKVKTGSGELFKYGTHAGQGGFDFSNNSYVSGSIYSNGNIFGAPGAYITGDAYVAGSTGTIINTGGGNFCVGGIAAGSSCSGSPAGNVHAHIVTNTNVAGTIYCQVGSPSNNKACNTSHTYQCNGISQTDPCQEDLPIPSSDIAQWKADATAGGVHTGNVIISTPISLADLGYNKIIGDLTVSSTLTLTNTLYVTGNILISIGGVVKLDPSYAATSGIIIADGYVTISNGVVFQDSGTPGSYILILSNSSCDESMSGSPCNGQNAIEVRNNSDISIVNAQQGTVYFSNNASVKEAVGNKIKLKNGVGVSYGTGSIAVDFTSGPPGAWVVDNWKETQ